jgi:hypothetical protein
MESNVLKEVIAVIRGEQKRRASIIKGEGEDFAYDQWQFIDKPFVNELCLMLLVTLRHQVERELVSLAARAAQKDEEISGEQYRENVDQLRKGKGWNWHEIINRLQTESIEQYPIMEALRLLANSYKHDPSMSPDKDLLRLLDLTTEKRYASLPESDLFQGGLAVFIGLGEDADYCDIAERFVNIASEFTSTVQSRIKLSRVKRGPISLHGRDLLF